MAISDTIEHLPRIQKPQIAALKKLGIFTVADLLLYFPYRYLDFSQVKQIKDLKPDENVSLKATIKNISSRFSFRSRMSLAEAVVSDETGSLKVTWFNQPYLATTLKPGDEVFLAGKPDYYNNALQLTNPIYEKASDFPVHTSRMVPLYHLKQGIYPKTFRNFIAAVLLLAKGVIDVLPREIIKNQGLLSIAETIHYSHFPDDASKLDKAKKRLAFEEIFLNQLLAQKHKAELAIKKAHTIKFDQSLVKTFVGSLPFKLTAGQKKAAWEVLQDLEKPMPMNRLLEGDVGSGKTLVALIAALQTTTYGYQVAFLAPTEILAKQHFETAKKVFKGLETTVSLLTNSYSEINSKTEPKAKLQALIKEGMPGLYIGTHALLAKKVTFKKLALVIIDEQHRFGVDQRAALFSVKGKVPHLLSLSATPIPRTLQLAFFGELDISQIKQKPAERKPIITKLVEPQNRTKAYEFITKQILAGRQAFVITPLIEQSETLQDVKSAKKEQENLQKTFPKFNIGLMHGKLKGAEKETVMADFLANKIQILVSTSVVEVGVDVPNASVMLIEAAERFGLAQLHQFRGRVGRAEHQSYCFVFTDKIDEPTTKRLTEFTKTQDGFELAELDLKQRGFGEVYGDQQSGWNFKYFDPSYTSLIQTAREEVIKLLREGINLDKYPLLKEKVQGKTVHFE
jgi:ATP-dependent DNA helicase RecG